MGFFQVQAQIQGLTADGWQSSRQVPTAYVLAGDAIEAGRAVSDQAWSMTDHAKSQRATFAAVIEVDADRVPTSPLVMTWVRVRYMGGDGIETIAADTYAAIKFTDADRQGWR